MLSFRYTNVILLVTILLFSCRTEEPTDFNEGFCPTGDIQSRHLLLGNPSGATTNSNNPNNYLIEMDEYTISYSRDRAIPNWVSWHLSEEWFDGDGSRQDDFRENPFLPADWNTPDDDSYEQSGFDRGHNCPSADRLCSDNFNSATFFMTNMIPQSPMHNQETWRIWECYFRYLASLGNELYIVMGNYGQGGDGFFGYRESIQDGDLTITVPESIWKVAIVIPEGDDDDLDAITNQSTVIAIDIPNSQAVANLEWNSSQFLTTVDDIEDKMGPGFDLFSNIPSNVQNILETQSYTPNISNVPCF